MHGIKNHRMWIKIHREINEKKLGIKFECEGEKTKIKSKIRLIYDLKLKSNIIGRRIRTKTQIQTQDRARNDPIDHLIKGFSFCDFENDRRHSKNNFTLFSPRNLTFKHPLDAEPNLEVKESKRFKDWDV